MILRLLLLALPALAVDVDGPPPRALSEWGLFTAEREPAKDLLPYNINTPLFSDFADKHRYIRLPEGAKAGYQDEKPLDFPVGTVIVKTFAYGKRWLETRLLVHATSGWKGYPYVWDAEMKEAALKPGGADIEGVEWTDRQGKKGTFKYLVPNMNQCKSCHEMGGKGTFGPIGPTARQLNRDGQLGKWAAMGKLEGLPEPKAVPKLARWDDPTASVNARARAWLEINCAHCHNPEGPASTAGIDLRSKIKDLGMVGVNRAPTAAGKGSGGRALDIVPGKPDESIFIYRLKSTDPGEMMPELGRKLVDEDAVRLISEWIAQLPAPR